MFCSNCGNKIGDGELFCGSCGTRVEDGESNQSGNIVTPVYRNEGMNNPDFVNRTATDTRKYRFIGIGAVAIGILAICLMFSSLFGGKRSYTDVVDKYIEAYYEAGKNSMSNICKLMPSEMSKLYKGAIQRHTEDVNSYLEKMGEDRKNKLDEAYGTGWKYTYKISHVYDLTKSQVEVLGEGYVDEGVYLKKKISAIKQIYVKVTIKSADGESEYTENKEIYVMKLGKKWYLEAGNTIFDNDVDY